MTGVVVIDTNLVVPLVVGSASKDYIIKHKRLQDYTAYDFELLGLILASFSGIILLPHVLAEVSSLARQIGNPARSGFKMLLKSRLQRQPSFQLKVSLPHCAMSSTILALPMQ